MGPPRRGYTPGSIRNFCERIGVAKSNSTVEVGMPYYLYQRRDVIRQTARHAAATPTETWLFTAGDGRDVILYGRGRDNKSWGQLRDWM